MKNKMTALLSALPLVLLLPLSAPASDKVTYPDPLPALESAAAAQSLDASALVLRETYGPNGVPVSALFKSAEVPEFRSTAEVVGDELSLSSEGTNFGLLLTQPTIVYPLTIDLKMRMEIEADGWVSVHALTRGRLASPEFRHDRMRDRNAKSNIAIQPEAMVTYRFVFDGDGRGRVYLLDGSDRSLPVGCAEAPKVPQERSSLDIRMKNAKVFIQEAALYIGMP